MQSKVKELQENADVSTIEKLIDYYGPSRAAGGIAASIARTAVDNFKKQRPDDTEKFIVTSMAEVFSDENFARVLLRVGLNEKEVINIYRRAIENYVNRKIHHEAYPGTGRNEPCPCGSFKKYKKCCGR